MKEEGIEDQEEVEEVMMKEEVGSSRAGSSARCISPCSERGSVFEMMIDESPTVLVQEEEEAEEVLPAYGDVVLNDQGSEKVEAEEVVHELKLD